MEARDPTPDASDVCNLPKPELRDRLSIIREDILPHVRHSGRVERGVAWEFDASPERRTQLEQFVEFERGCCGGLDFDLQELPEQNRLRLCVSGEGVQAFAALATATPTAEVAAEGAAPAAAAPPPHALRHWLQAGGLGFSAAFVLFCVLPLTAAAWGGASLAAHLAQLDDPRLIAGGTLALALPAWLYLTRRARRQSS